MFIRVVTWRGQTLLLRTSFLWTSFLWTLCLQDIMPTRHQTLCIGASYFSTDNLWSICKGMNTRSTNVCTEPCFIEQMQRRKFFYMLRSFKRWAIKALQNLLFFVALCRYSTFLFFTLFLRSAIHSHMIIRGVSRRCQTLCYEHLANRTLCLPDIRHCA